MRLIMLASALGALVSCNVEAPGPQAVREPETVMRANQFQTIGTHNSFKQWLSEPELALIAAVNPEAARSLEYGHPPIAEQLAAGARQLELDPYYDPDGGRYADPLGPRMLASQGAEVPPFDASELTGAGLKVFHTPDIDYRSHCLTFIACLEQVKAW